MTKGTLSRREFLRLSATLTAGVVAAACAPAAAPAQPAASSGAEPAKAAETVELRFIKLAMSESVAAYFNDTAIPKFMEANPNIKVSVDMSDWDHLGEKMLTSFAGNLPLDLIETGSDWVGPYARRKQFAALDDYVTKDYQDEIADFYPDMVAISKYEGKLMALPYILDIRTTCYRKDHFQEAGLDPEKGPDTWDDLVTFGKKLVKSDAQGNVTRAGYQINAGRPTDAIFELWYLLVQNGTDVVVPWGSWQTKDVVFNGPEGVEALQFLYDLINTHKISPIEGMSTQNPSLSTLAEGVTSMATANAGVVGNWKQYQPDTLSQLGVGVPLLRKKRLQYACPNVYTTGTNTKHPDEAWLLMKYMISSEVITGMLAPDNSAPPRKSVATNAEYMKDPLLTKFQDVVDKGWGATTPQAVDFPTLTIIGNYVQAALRDEMGVKEALDKAADEVKKKIDELLQAV